MLDAIGFVELSTAVDNFVRNCKCGIAKPPLQRQAQACCTNAANKIRLCNQVLGDRLCYALGGALGRALARQNVGINVGYAARYGA